MPTSVPWLLAAQRATKAKHGEHSPAEQITDKARTPRNSLSDAPVVDNQRKCSQQHHSLAARRVAAY